MNYFEWTSDSTSPYNGYNYTSKDKTYYGVHTVEVQFGNNPPVSIEAKFDTGAKSTSISFPLGKKLGVSEEFFKAAQELEEHKIEKNVGERELKKKVDDLSKKYNLILESIKSASGITIRVYLPITIYHNGRIIKTQANLKDRSGLSTEMLIGLQDLL